MNEINKHLDTTNYPLFFRLSTKIKKKDILRSKIVIKKYGDREVQIPIKTYYKPI
jgi:hypothetical protein